MILDFRNDYSCSYKYISDRYCNNNGGYGIHLGLIKNYTSFENLILWKKKKKKNILRHVAIRSK